MSVETSKSSTLPDSPMTSVSFGSLVHFKADRIAIDAVRWGMNSVLVNLMGLTFFPPLVRAVTCVHKTAVESQYLITEKEDSKVQ